jgi:WD domain, G-beta repeat
MNSYRKILVVSGVLASAVHGSAAGQPMQRISMNAQVNGVSYSPDGSRIAVAVEDGRLVMVDGTGARILSEHRPHREAVNAAVFSPDGRILATSGQNGEIVLWDPADMREIRRLHGHQGAVYRLAFSPDGRLLASGGDDKSVRTWNVTTGDVVNSFAGHPGLVVSLAFSPNGRVLASASLRARLRTGRTLILRDVGTGRALMELTPHAYRGYGRSESIYAVLFSPDGRELASGSDNREIILWDNLVSDTLVMLEGHRGAVTSLAMSPDGRLLASGGLDRRTLVWSRGTGRVAFELPVADDWVWSVAFSPDGQRLAHGSKDGSVRVWDLSERIAALTPEMPVAAQPGRVQAEADRGPRVVLFTLEPGEYGVAEMSADPFAVFESGRFVSPSEGFIPKGGFTYNGDSREASRRIREAYFPARGSLDVLRGGVRIGSATFNRVDYDGPDLFDGCFLGFGATARGTFTAPPRARQFVGVTGGGEFPEGRSTRRAASAAERSSFLAHARDVLRGLGVPAGALASIRVFTDAGQEVEMIDLDRDGSPELVGTVEAGGDGSQHNLLLIVSSGARGTRPVLVSYHRSAAEIGGNQSHETERFVDHLDIDGDGVDEVIATKARYEGMYYVIFKRSGSASEWSMVYRGGGGGC